MTRLPAALVLIVALPTLKAGIIYNSIPAALPANVPSLGFEATSTQEFGGLIRFDEAGYSLMTATVVMSSWALESIYEAIGTSSGYTVDLTFNLYQVGVDNSAGDRIASQTVQALIPWRPEADPSCPGGTGWRAADGQCYNGLAANVVIPIQAVLPQEVIFGVAFNTQHHGYEPTNVPGPYNSLNFGLSTESPSVGSSPLPGTVYWNTSHAAFYADAGAGGVGIFRQDTDWAPYSGAIQLESVPEPPSWTLPSLGLLALWVGRKKIHSHLS